MLSQIKGGVVGKNKNSRIGKKAKGKFTKEKIFLTKTFNSDFRSGSNREMWAVSKTTESNNSQYFFEVTDKLFPTITDIALTTNNDILTNVIMTTEFIHDSNTFINHIKSYKLQKQIYEAGLSAKILGVCLIVVNEDGEPINVNGKSYPNMISVYDIIDYDDDNITTTFNNLLYKITLDLREIKFNIQFVRFMEKCYVEDPLRGNYNGDKEQYFTESLKMLMETSTKTFHGLRVVDYDLKPANVGKRPDGKFVWIDCDAKYMGLFDLTDSQYKSYIVVLWVSIFVANDPNFLDNIQERENYSTISCRNFMTVIVKTHQKIKITQMFNYLSESEIMRPVFNGINTDDFDSTLQMVLIIYMIYYIFFSVTKNIVKKDLFSEKIKEVLEDTESSQNYDELGIEITRLVKEERHISKPDQRRTPNNSTRSTNKIHGKLGLPTGAFNANASLRSGRNPNIAAIARRLRQQSKSSGSNGGSPKTRKKKFRKNKLETHL